MTFTFLFYVVAAASHAVGGFDFRSSLCFFFVFLYVQCFLAFSTGCHNHISLI